MRVYKGSSTKAFLISIMSAITLFLAPSPARSIPPDQRDCVGASTQIESGELKPLEDMTIKVPTSTGERQCIIQFSAEYAQILMSNIVLMGYQIDQSPTCIDENSGLVEGPMFFSPQFSPAPRVDVFVVGQEVIPSINGSNTIINFISLNKDSHTIRPCARIFDEQDLPAFLQRRCISVECRTR
jgi:hypothetical protein